jgi:lipoate-protein ligase A
VGNVSGMLSERITVEEFSNRYKKFIFNNFDEVFEENLTGEEDAAIRDLAEEKYRTYRWNFGYSPEYEFNNKWYYKEDEYSVKLLVKEGRIAKAELSGLDEYPISLEEIAEQLIGIFHERNSIRESFNIFSDRYDELFLNQILDHLF